MSTPTLAVARPPQLTQRERQYLELGAQGLTNSDIGRRLYLSEDTIKSHARSAMRKLGVHDRTCAVIRALQLGILAIPGITVTAPVVMCEPHRGPGPTVTLAPTDHDAALLARALAGGREPHDAAQARALDALRRLAGIAS